VRGRERPNTDAKILFTRPKGFKINYVQVAFRDNLLWIKSDHGTWYAADFTTF